MDLQYSTACLAYLPISRSFALARNMGLNGLQLSLTPLLYNRGPERLCRIAERSGIAIRSLDMSYLGEAVLDPRLIAGFAAFTTALPDCHTIVLPTPRTEGSLNGYLAALQQYAQALGDHTAVTIVNASANATAPGPLDRFPQLRRVIEEWEYGYTFDSSHAASSGWVITEPLPQMGNRLCNVHLNDFRPRPSQTGFGADPLLPDRAPGAQLGRAPGEGILPLRAFLRALQRRGYTGLLTLDLRVVGPRAWWPPSLYGRLLAAITFCRETLATYEPLPGQQPRITHQAPAEAENEGRTT